VLPRARQPLLTLSNNTGGITECDVSINNRLPLNNTRLLRSYSELDDRVRPLVLLIKSWAKNYGVCGAHLGNLSSYAWTIMVIHYLQLLKMLPALQTLAKQSVIIVDQDYWGHERKFDVSFLTAEEYLRESGTKFSNNAAQHFSLGELVYGFFRFFCQEYQWGNEVVSIRVPGRHAADPWFKLYGKIYPEPGIHVEDPIEL